MIFSKYFSKSIFSVLFFISFYSAHSQNNTNQPCIIGDTLFLKSGHSFIKGKKIQLGEGTGLNGTFEYISVAGVNWEGIAFQKNQNDNTRILNNETVQIVDVRKFKRGKKSVQFLIKIP